MQYEELIDPRNLFSSLQEVREFCDVAEAVEDLQAFLTVCEELELYEYCSIIRQKIEKLRGLL